MLIEYLQSGFFAPYTAHVEGFALYLLLMLLGGLISILSGLFGVGGGFILVPLLNVFLGIPMDVAVGSSLLYILGTSGLSFYHHIKQGNVESMGVVLISLGSVFGAVLGDVVQDALKYFFSSGGPLAFDQAMRVVYFFFLLFIAWLTYRSPEQREQGLLQRISWGPSIDLLKAGRKSVNIPGLMVMGVLAGFFTGLLGVSGGVLLVPLFFVLVGFPFPLAVGTSIGVVVVTSFSAIISKSVGTGDKINLFIALALFLASIAGVRIGVFLGRKIHSNRLKRAFSAVVLLAAIIVCIKFLVDI